MELSMDNMDIVAGGILAIMLALFMLTVIVTLFALSHRIRLLSNEIYKIEKQTAGRDDGRSEHRSRAPRAVWQAIRRWPDNIKGVNQYGA